MKTSIVKDPAQSVFGFLALALGIVVGLRLADFDQVLPFLLHRSMVTHSPLIPMLLAVFAITGSHWRRLAVVGIALAMAVHLSFDLYPKGWYGFALIHWPIIPAPLPMTMSILWITLSIAACLYLGLLLLRSYWETVLALGMAILGFITAVGKESTFWQPTLTLLCVFVLVTCLPNPMVPGSRIALRLWTNRRRTTYTKKP